jgi:NADH:ubiquinone oxidoreductase subunit 5 (subunit L)/multisubunit Na+/H+ antiporter MnhA subunit
MSEFINFFILVPLLGFVVSLLLPGKKENLLSITAFLTIGVHLVAAWIFIVLWLAGDHQALHIKDIVFYKDSHYEFFVDFAFDKITMAYLFVGSFLIFLITIYSRYYLHREVGYKRFFNTLLFFYIGYNIIIFSGNMETMFIGWEILGLSSFLLIAFYRDRYLPVKNAVKVFSIYRVGDVGLILAMWMSHHLFQGNITFLELSNYDVVHEHLQSHSVIGVFISIMILTAAVAKSAQFPFSSWLPRAMEGPTPSSAIYYGSLSVHIGIFVLLRTFPFWEHQLTVRILIGLMGLTSSLIATGIARVQSSVKSQIAYSSIAQIGLIMIEVAFGFTDLALIHFAGNAFLRTYQLLVSPSVVTYLIREQFYNFKPREHTIEDSWPKRVEYSLYILCLKEWNMDSFMYRFLWNPLKHAGNQMNFLNVQRVFYFFVPSYLIGLFCVYNKELISPTLQAYFPFLFSLIGLIMVLKAFTERKDVFLAWILTIMNHFWVALAISFNETFSFDQVHLYLSGIAACGAFGLLVLHRLKRLETYIDLDQFHGHSYRHPKMALVFLLSSLGVSGFPITPSFIGEDLMFSHIGESQVMLALFTSLSFIIDGLAIIRIYARVFMGPHIKSMHEMAYRSS